MQSRLAPDYGLPIADCPPACLPADLPSNFGSNEPFFPHPSLLSPHLIVIKPTTQAQIKRQRLSKILQTKESNTAQCSPRYCTYLL